MARGQSTGNKVTNIFIIGNKKSTIYKTIHKETGIPIYKDQYRNADAIINYGVSGENLRTFFKIHPRAKKIPMINKFIGCSKFKAVIDAKKQDIPVPETKLILSQRDELEGWIEKRFHSCSGKGIRFARQRGTMVGKYYQKMITPRRYELRVHTFKWIPVNEWSVQKRIGPADQIAWNFHQGGKFITMHNASTFSVFKEAMDLSEKILEIRNMSFGAVDFIVAQNLGVYFIEINSAPGFSNLSAPIYINAFSALKDIKYLKRAF